MKFTIEFEQEPDGSCWVAEIMELPGCIIDGATKEEAIKNAKALALKIIAERIEFEKESEQADITDLSFVLANG
jgi:predicted RNase H-like HicB family nuclease